MRDPYVSWGVFNSFLVKEGFEGKQHNPHLSIYGKVDNACGVKVLLDYAWLSRTTWELRVGMTPIAYL